MMAMSKRLGRFALALILLLYAASATTYSNYQYDMTVPQFTPDGRLLQVEYASAAVDHSAPLIVVRLVGDSGDGSDDTSDNKTDGNGAEMILLMAARRSRSSLERLVVLPDSDCVLGMSGVLADSLWLLRSVQEESRNHRRQYGRPLSAAQVVTAIANDCQNHAFGGGLRPFGSTIVVCGILPEESATRALRAWQTDPSGALQTLPTAFHVIGGGGTLRTSIHRRLQSEHVDQKPISEAILSVYDILTQEAKRVDKEIEEVEVAVMSFDKGIYKLTPEQVDKLLLVQRKGR